MMQSLGFVDCSMTTLMTAVTHLMLVSPLKQYRPHRSFSHIILAVSVLVLRNVVIMSQVRVLHRLQWKCVMSGLRKKGQVHRPYIFNFESVM